jgi:glycosyltransferase involved in cell wall biosynthesis
MLTDTSFIVFSDDWGRHPFSCMHLMNKFLYNNRILWVNTIGMRYPRFTLYDLKRATEKISCWFSTEEVAPVELPKNLTIINPPMIPYNNIPFIRLWNRHSVVSKIKAAMSRLEFRNPIVIITVPNATDYLGFLGERLAVYYCVDEFAEWPGVARQLVIEMETALLRKVDLIVAVSDELAQHKKTSLGPTRLLTHGVDIQHFAKVGSISSGDSIPFFDTITGPVIGYFGLFDARTDQQLLEHLLVTHPEWNVVILGRSVVDMKSLQRYKNFFHHGPVPYDELPNWASKFDVCIIPYVMNKLTANINPLKLKEYLATGKPIVSTPLPEAVKFANVIRIGQNHNEFIKQVEIELTQHHKPELQLRAVVGEDWGDKAEQFSGWIEQALGQKHDQPAVTA